MPDAPSRDFLALQTALAGRYSLERELGRGGMGIVYLAHEVSLDRPVALKVLPPLVATQAPLRERFLREARTAAKLSHPHIVPIFAVDQVGDFVFFAMAYVDGETLGQRIRARGPIPAGEAARVIREVAWALAYAHAQGVVHRDVKPDNILLERGTGRALVSDFGIAHVRDVAGPTAVGELLGTAEFMSPEQASGEPVDGRSDLYSLGALGFYAITGRLPFEGPTVAALLAKRVTLPAPPVTSVAPEAPRRLAQAIDRCLAKEPAGRFQSGEELAEVVGRALDVQRELPVPLRVFIKHNRETWRTGWSAAILIDLLFFPSLMGAAATGDLGGALGLTGFMAAVLASPLFARVQVARRLLKAGHSREEAVTALRGDIERRREELLFEFGRRPSRFERVAYGTAIAGLAGFAAGAGLLAFGNLDIGAPLMAMAGTVAIGGLVVGGLRRERRRDLVGERRLKLWKGRIGDWVFRVARVRLKRVAPTGGATHQPTELALSLAADRLFDELPKAMRRALKDLPGVVRKLENDARRTRQRIEELDTLLGDVGGGAPVANGRYPAAGAERDRLASDLRAARQAAHQRMTEAVTALETIRLDLLRMHAGAGAVTTLTADLAAARSLSEGLERLLRGQEEVERMLKAAHTMGTTEAGRDGTAEREAAP
jgi:serine/threonine-protein kinase